MTVIHFTKNIKCESGMECGKDCIDKILALTPGVTLAKEMHVTIYHTNNNHQFWCTYYDKGTHEDWVRGQSVHTKFNATQKKFTGQLPTEKEIKAVI